MGYRMLPGIPLERSMVDDLARDDPAAFARLGEQLGEFLRELHAQDVGGLAGRLPCADDRAFWEEMRDAFRSALFAYMRPEARADVEQQFDAFLADDGNFRWQPVLRHGDVGGANLLYDPAERRLSGVIDFGAVALGDRATDLTSLFAFHEWLASSVQPTYPELFSPDARRRAAFYRSTFALQQALWAQRAGDIEEFNDGITAYV